MQVTFRFPIDVPEHVNPRTVLLISADEPWRSAAAHALAQAGYRVIATRHTGQALVESSRSQSIDVVVAFDGGQLSARIFRNHPEARVLHFSTRPRPRRLLDLIAASLK